MTFDTGSPADGAPAALALSALLGSSSPDRLLAEDAATGCRVSHLALDEGIDLVLWRGDLSEPLTLDVHDDWQRVNFSCALSGHSRFRFHTPAGVSDHAMAPGMGCVSYTPGCRGCCEHSGRIETISISMAPDLVDDHVADAAPLRRQLRSGRCCAMFQGGSELNASATALRRFLVPAPGAPPMSGCDRLRLLGEGLVFASLALERANGIGDVRISEADRRRLDRARDLLLADLAQAPTIAMLARETGLSVVKIKRGFRGMFGESVYALFQKERMHEARRRLHAGNASVMTVAVDLGYSNASHFASAFRKQFGLPPSAIKRGG